MPTGPFCGGCCNQPYGQRLISFNGTGTSGIMLVLESPWTDEIAAGEPAAGAAGGVLDRLLQRVDLDRRDVIVTNSAWCKAPRLGFYDSRDPNAAMAMAQCRPYLDALIDRMKPKVLVPMGNVALRRVCGVSGIESYAGYVLDTVYGIPAVPTFHPSYIMQGNQKLSPVVIYALDRAKEISRHGFVRPNYNLMLDPSVGDLTVYVRDKLLGMGGSVPSLFIDLETPESANLDEEEVDEKGKSWQIIRASFAIEDGTAVSFPWTAPYIDILQRVIAQSGEVVEWATNHFDTKRLRAVGLALPARCVSALWAWHWLQSDLRKGLEYVAPFFGACTPWKHRNISDPAFYSAMDSLEGRRCYQGTMAALKAYGRWDSFNRHCVDADPILQTMGKTGILIDPVQREQFMGVLQTEHDAAFSELQTVVPLAARTRKYYKKLPKGDSPWSLIRLKPMSEIELSGSQPMDPANIVAPGNGSKFITLPTKVVSSRSTVEGIKTSGMPPKINEQSNLESVSLCVKSAIRQKLNEPSAGELSSTVPQLDTVAGVDVEAVSRLCETTTENSSSYVPSLESQPESACADSQKDAVLQDFQLMPTEPATSLIWQTGYRYARILPFNPQSWAQVQELASCLSIKLPKKRDAEDDDDVSTERKYLLAPARKHRAFALVLSCRERGKLLSTYNWPTDRMGRATTIYGWHPSTLRKSSRSVNLQNIPKRSKLAKQFRKMIVAAPGHLLIEADSSAIEAVLVGWFAGSPRYIKLAKAGVHGWLTAAYHGKVYSIDDPDLPQLASESKLAWPDDYEKCKRIVHLSNYKGTPIRIAEEYPEEFPTVASARKLQAFYFETEPGQDVRKWQDAVCIRAAHDCYLDNPFGYRHWFYEVSHYDKRRDKFIPGDDAKRAVAFLPQSTASAVQTEYLLEMVNRLRPWLRMIVHDSFLNEAPEEHAMENAAVMRDVMLQPISQLGGLTIGVEVSVGRNWAPADASNPDGMHKI